MTDLLKQWLERKNAEGHWYLKAPVTISHTYHIHTGPRYIFGAVTLAASPAETFAFSSKVKWPDGNNCDTLVLDGILDVIVTSEYRPVLGVVFELQAIDWHEADNAPIGYYFAAKEATKKVLRLEQLEYNIAFEWPIINAGQ